MIYVTHIDTPVGSMVAAASADGLCLLEFDRPGREEQLTRLSKRMSSDVTYGDNDVLEQTREELGAYFARASTTFTVSLHPIGTEFQQSVWRALKTIPYGQTRSYGQQAQSLGMLDAIRAVAKANGDNPVAIIIPCHRVIGADGTLTGYGGGLWRKKWLLEHEQGVLQLF